jgi:hypothetical protein
MYSFTDLNEIHLSCVEDVQVCVEKDVFISVDSLHRKNILNFQC